MLTPLDDTLWHQLPTTFDHVGTSDPRFYDRWWFASYDPSGAGALQCTLAVYSNMDVVDGGFVAVAGGRQRNVRVSRALRPRFEPVCGPLRVEVLEPLQRFRLVLEPGEHPVHGELEWTATGPVEEEQPHFSRTRGRVVEDYQRFDQTGVCNGELALEGTHVAVEDWWACRDHSWGVRPGIAVPEPVTGETPPMGASSTFAFLFYSGGHVQIAVRDGRRVYLTGAVEGREVVDADLRVELVPGTRRFSTATITATLDDGRTVELRCDALGPSIAMPGLGYSGGYDDGQGLGVWRGVEHLEADVWDVTHAEDVVLADGTVTKPVHRIQPVRVNGEGVASMTLIVPA